MDIFIRLRLLVARELWPEIEFDDAAISIGVAISTSDSVSLYAVPHCEYFVNERIVYLEKRAVVPLGGTRVTLKKWKKDEERNKSSNIGWWGAKRSVSGRAG